MSFSITKHPLVESDLDEIDDLIANYAGRDVSIRKIGAILAFVETLRDFPKIGTVRQDILPGLRAIPASDKAIVCFVVNDHDRTIHILAVTYGGIDWQKRIVGRQIGNI